MRKLALYAFLALLFCTSAYALGGTSGTGTGTSLTGSSSGGGGGGSTALSALTSGTTTNTIDSTSNAQTWNWSSLAGNTALTLTSSVSSGKVFSVTATGAVANTGYGGYFSNTSTAGYAGYFNGAVTVTGLFTDFVTTHALSAVTTYTVLATDMGLNLTTTSGSSVAVTLPQAGSAGFTAGLGFGYVNLGPSTVTFTPQTSTVNGAASLAFLQGQGGFFLSNAVGNWDVNLGSARGNAAITGGTINGTTLGATTSAVATITTLTTANASLGGTTTANNLSVTGTCTGCGSGAAFTPVLPPLSVTTTDVAGNAFPYTYFDSTTTGAVAVGSPGYGIVASLGADVSYRFRFMMPPTLPTSGTLNLCSVCQANATTGNVKYTISDADINTNNTASVGATVFNSETQTSVTWSAVDNYVTTCTPLTEVPVANHISAGAITFNTSGYTLAQILSCNFIERWQ